MTAAVNAIIPFAFATLKLHRIEAACIPANVASIRLLEKTGFKRRRLCPPISFASMARGRTTCCTLGSRMTSIRSSGPPWGRHGLTGITRVGGAACGEKLSNSMYRVRGDERERGGPAVVALMGAVALSGCSGPRASSIARRRSAAGSPTFLQREAGRYATGIADAFGARGRVSGVDIRTGASTLEVAAKSEQPTAGDLRHQPLFGQTARECLAQAGTMSIKVGVQGRVILGPMGAPGQINVPLRYAVVREGPEPKTIATKFKRLSVAVPADQTHK